MRLSKRSQLEFGAFLGIVGLAVILVTAFRFDAFRDSDQRFRNEFEPYLITQAMRQPVSSKDNYDMYIHRKIVYDFYPSGNRYSRCRDFVLGGSSGMIIVAMGTWVCLRARRRKDVLA